jgi:thymidine kinase
MPNKLFTPGYFEIYAGPMYSGKTKELDHRLSVLKYQSHIGSVLFKPDIDNRDEKSLTKERYLNNGLEAIIIPSDNPSKIFDIDLPEIVAFDEIQFYHSSITDVVRRLISEKHHVLGAGLDLNFRGETFGPMGDLMALANEVHKLIAVCDNCTSNIGTRTQRLKDGNPAHYDEPLVRIEGADTSEKYQPRCIECHEVPKKQDYLVAEKGRLK